MKSVQKKIDIFNFLYIFFASYKNKLQNQINIFFNDKLLKYKGKIKNNIG